MDSNAIGHDPVVVVGAGLSGLATALGCALAGRPVVVLEAADMVGGAAAWSGGQVWVGADHVAAARGISDDLARAECYVRGLPHDQPDLLGEQALQRCSPPRRRRCATASGPARSAGR